MMKKRLWRVDIKHVSGCQAPSFWVETSTHVSKLREVAEIEAIKLAKSQSGLGRFDSWTFEVTHLEDHFYLETPHWAKWVKQGVYKRNDNGVWVKNRPEPEEDEAED